MTENKKIPLNISKDEYIALAGEIEKIIGEERREERNAMDKDNIDYSGGNRG